MNAPRRHPLVEADVERIAFWYDGKQPGLGDDFADEVMGIIEIIARHPLRYSIRFGRWRRANLRRFPYSVFYQVFGEKPVIFAVLSGRSDFKLMLESRMPEKSGA